MHRRLALLALVVVAACGGEPVRTPVAATRPTARSKAEPPPMQPRAGLVAAPPPTKLDGRLVAVSARALPERFVVDGQLNEWGARTTAAEAASRVVVGIGSTRVGIAAELRAAARDGVRLKLRFPVFELGKLEEDPYSDASGKRPRCEREHPKDAAATEACRAEILTRQKRFHAELVARFVQVYRVDASGVRLAVGGQLVPIPGASLAKRADADGLSLEAELPLAALPRSADAPIKNVSVAVRVDGDPASVAAADDVVSVLAPPVDFEPNAAVRAAVFDGSQFWSSPRFHYQPGDPSSFAVSGFPQLDAVSGIEDRSRYTETTQRLFVPLRTFSDFTIVKLYPDKLGTMRDGKLISSGWGAGELRGFVERNGELHAFILWRGTAIIEDRRNGAYELPAAHWSALAIQRDGTVRQLDLDQPDGPFKRFLRETHAPDFSTFSVEGEAEPLFDPDSHGARTMERYVWRWDDKEKTYRESFTQTKLGGAPKTR